MRDGPSQRSAVLAERSFGVVDVRLDAADGQSVVMVDGTGRVRQAVAANRGDASGHVADFVCAYEIDISPDDGRSAEQWARAAWEGTPAPLRWFMVAGWRFVLGLRLGPRPSPDHILGWRITDRSPDDTVCQLDARFLRARNTFQRIDTRLVWSTFVTYDRAIARFIWPPVSLLHRPLVRLALRRAAHARQR